jgi:AraC family transcriptional regulator
MRRFIDENLDKHLTLSMIAKKAGYSPWHASRIYSSVIGKSPFEYIKSKRLNEAAKDLREGDNKIIDVAFDYLFDSHEGFTRAFSKEFGMAPREFRKAAKKVPAFLPDSFRGYYLKKQMEDDEMKNEKPEAIFVQVVKRPKRKMILKRGVRATHYFEYCEEAGCDVWEVLTSIKEAIYEPVGMWLPENMIKPGTSVYAQGVEVDKDYSDELPEGFEIIDLPPCSMMVFQSEPYDDEKFEDAIDMVWEKMKSFDPGIYGYKYSDEDGPRIQLEPQGYRGYIEARPVRKIAK